MNKGKQAFIAITTPGSEYLYNRASMIKVSPGKAKHIAAALNAASYELKAGQIWYVYTADSNADLMYCARQARDYKSKVIISEYYHRPEYLF